MTSHSTIARTPDTADRWWLPGPPPRRRQIAIETIDLSAFPDELSGRPPVPIRQVDLWSTHNRTGTLQAYFESQCPFTGRGNSNSNSLIGPLLSHGPESKPNAGPRSFSPNSAASEMDLYLFHCCANEVTPALLQSFARRGPSIRFARRNGYFSRTPAVYWTNSLPFAFAWGVFTATGEWTAPRPSERFECIVHVAKVNLAQIQTPHGTYLMDPPSCTEMEQKLVEV
jgi:hypothetical protein